MDYEPGQCACGYQGSGTAAFYEALGANKGYISWVIGNCEALLSAVDPVLKLTSENIGWNLISGGSAGRGHRFWPGLLYLGPEHDAGSVNPHVGRRGDVCSGIISWSAALLRERRKRNLKSCDGQGFIFESSDFLREADTSFGDAKAEILEAFSSNSLPSTSGLAYHPHLPLQLHKAW